MRQYVVCVLCVVLQDSQIQSVARRLHSHHLPTAQVSVAALMVLILVLSDQPYCYIINTTLC